MGGAYEARDPSEVKVENSVRQGGDSNPATQDTKLAPYPQGYRCQDLQSLRQTQLFVPKWTLTAK